MSENIHDTVDRLVSLVERQQQTIDELESTVKRQQERIDELQEGRESVDGQENEEESTLDDGGMLPSVTRRGVLKTGGALALLGAGAGSASADPQGTLGSKPDDIDTLYLATLTGELTGNTPITDLVGSGLTVSSGALETTSVAHTDLTGVSADQHHAKDHDHTEGGISKIPNSGLENSSIVIEPETGLERSAGNEATELGSNVGISIKSDGVGGTELDLADIAGDNLSVDTNNNELDASSGTSSHTNLTDVKSDQHHAKDHDHTSISKIPNRGLKKPFIILEVGNAFEYTAGSSQHVLGGGAQLELATDGVEGDAINVSDIAGQNLTASPLNQHLDADLDHSDLTGVSPDDHHAEDHDHTETGISTIPNSGLENSNFTLLAGEGLTYDSGNARIPLGGVSELVLEDDGVGGRELDLADIAGKNLTVDTTDEELDADKYKGATATRNATQDLSGNSKNTDIVIEFDTEKHDTDDTYLPSEYAYKTPKKGYYAVSVTVNVNRDYDDEYFVQLQKSSDNVSWTDIKQAKARCTSSEILASVSRTIQRDKDEYLRAVIHLIGGIESNDKILSGTLSVDYLGQK